MNIQNVFLNIQHFFLNIQDIKKRLCGPNLMGFTPFSRFDIARLRWTRNHRVNLSLKT